MSINTFCVPIYSSKYFYLNNMNVVLLKFIYYNKFNLSFGVRSVVNRKSFSTCRRAMIGVRPNIQILMRI